ncbi:MAG: T9SS type A sorting domain-containing protein [Marinilabiliaceae bacterium]|jgi:hypothetical protein|nr:T9SS type A sorting domain-containing protein [Marinilabiliaceae bacterium]
MRLFICVLIALAASAAAGQGSLQLKAVNSAIHADSSIIISWANTIRVLPGFMDISARESGRVDISDSSLALGHADNRTISLGDSGIAVVGFPLPLMNTAGPDFAVFENSFDGKFLELAQVEVSTDSSRWVKFYSVSLTDTLSQLGTFGTIDTGNIKNLAGKFRSFYGTGFDLEELKDSSGIDIMNINYIRLTDVIGRIDHPFPVRSSDGRIINDPWPTPFATSGFDLDAVAVLGSGVSVVNTREAAQLKVYPNPSAGLVQIEAIIPGMENLKLIAPDGRLIRQFDLRTSGLTIDMQDLPSGLYYLVPSDKTNSAIAVILNRQ